MIYLHGTSESQVKASNYFGAISSYIEQELKDMDSLNDLVLIYIQVDDALIPVKNIKNQEFKEVDAIVNEINSNQDSNFNSDNQIFKIYSEHIDIVNN